MTLTLRQMDRIEADIEGVFAGAKEVEVSARVVGATAIELRAQSQSLPDMPPGVRRAVADAMNDAAKAGDKIAALVDEEFKLLDRRMRAFIRAVMDEQTTNMDKVRHWFNGYIDKHDRELDSAFDFATRPYFRRIPGFDVGGPSVGPVDGGSFFRGLGNAAIGTIDIGQLVTRATWGDRDAHTQLGNIGESIRRDPMGALKQMVSWKELKVLTDEEATEQQKRDALGTLLGGATFDALGRLGRLSKLRRIGAGKSGLDNARRSVAENKAQSARVAAERARVAAETATRRRVAIRDQIGLLTPLADVLRVLLGRPTRLGDLYRALRAERVAERVAAKAADVERKLKLRQQLTAEEVRFRQAARKVFGTRLDTADLRAGAAAVNEVLGLALVSVPVSVRDAMQLLVEAAGVGGKQASDVDGGLGEAPPKRRRVDIPRAVPPAPGGHA